MHILGAAETPGNISTVMIQHSSDIELLYIFGEILIYNSQILLLSDDCESEGQASIVDQVFDGSQ